MSNCWSWKCMESTKCYWRLCLHNPKQKRSNFSKNVKSLHGTNIFLADENISLSNLTFSGLGLYDDIYLKARNKYIFEPTTYQAMQSGITMFISNGKESEEDILSGNLNFLDMVNYDELLGVIFDVSFFSWITPFMTVLGSGSLENI